MPALSPPEIILTSALRLWPSLIGDLQAARALRGKNFPLWDERVYFPLWLLTSLLEKSRQEEDASASLASFAFHGAAWSRARRVIRLGSGDWEKFRDSGARFLGASLAGLSEYSVYVESQGLQARGGLWNGFMATIDCEENGRLIMRFLLLKKNGQDECEFFSFASPRDCAPF